MALLATHSKLSFEQFLRDYPDGRGVCELINGEVVEMRSTRGHDQIADELLFTFNDEIRKIPTVFVYGLNSEGNYERQAYQGEALIKSAIFPDLQLTVQ